ncbi:MAG TPA: carboxypeptidase regulatory-like domain-containing protein [Pyrinomonadaceae bacterium]
MTSKSFIRTLFAALFLAAFSVAASAQTTQVNGTVKLKQADGTEVPVVGAQIDIYRTDIKSEYHTKTDKKGHYIHAGLPFVGTYTIIVSAPGARPTWASKQRFTTSQQRDFLLQPGDGSKLTLEQTKTFDAGGGGGAPTAPAGGGSAPSGESKEDKAKREELDRKVKEVEEKNRKIEEGNAVIARTFKAGNDALQANRLDEAIASYQEGLAARADEPALLTNLSEALRRRGVNRYNDALKAEGDARNQGVEVAKKDWKEAAEASQKALQIINTGGADPQQAAIYAQNKIVALSTRALAMRLVATKVDQTQAQTAWDAYQEYIAVEADPVKKAKFKGEALQMLFDAGSVDLAVTQARAVLTEDPDNVDANRILGLALFATGDKAKFQEAANYLQRYVDKAPDTDPLKLSAKESLDYLKTAENVKPEKAPARPPRGRRP